MPDEPAGSAVVVANEAGPTAPVASPAEPQGGQTTPNWEIDANPYRQRWLSNQGMLKSEAAKRTAAEQRAQQVEAEAADLRARVKLMDDLAREQDFEKTLAEANPEDPVVKRVMEGHQAQKLRRQIEAELRPQFETAAEQRARERYSRFAVDVGQKLGLEPAEIAALAQKPDQTYDKLIEEYTQLARRKLMDEQEKTREDWFEKKWAEKSQAETTRAAAQGRAQTSAPNPDTGQPPARNDDGSFLADYAAGRLSGKEHHKRARAILAGL